MFVLSVKKKRLAPLFLEDHHASQKFGTEILLSV